LTYQKADKPSLIKKHSLIYNILVKKKKLRQKIKQLTSETAIYGISTILGRFLNFILVPLYTNVLKTETYGISTNLFAYMAIFNVIYSFGLEAAYFKYASTKELGNTRENFSTPLLSIFLTSSMFTILIYAFTVPIGNMISVPVKYNSIIKWSAWTLFFDALAVIPFASLRIENKSKKFALIKFINITINVALNIILILKFKKGLEGIFISAFFASLFTLILLFPEIKKKFKFHFPAKLYTELLRFGLPYLPSALSSTFVQVINRPMMEKLSDLDSVGVFQANYRLGIFMMLIVSMFEYAWRPFFLSNAKEPDAKQLFSRILTYFTLLGAFVFLAVSLFIEDIVKIPIPGRGYIIGKDYWGGLGVVPIILLSYVFNGLYTNFIVGVYIEKKTKHMPLITGLAALTNIIFNLILIPPFNLMGAAYATLLSYIVMAGGMYYLNQKIYPIKYEYKRLIKIALITAFVFVLYLFIDNKFSIFIEIIIKVFLIFVFILLFFIIKFFNKGEIVQVKELLRKVGLNKLAKK
jgi:O-antigen/teichoic acid export membrane protein